MRPYGLPRQWKHPDMYDAHLYGLKGSSVNLPGKNREDIHAASHNTEKKNRMRRLWKKKERKGVTKDLRNYLNESD